MNEALPAWVGTLREDAALSGELGIRWLDEDERRHLHAGATSVALDLAASDLDGALENLEGLCVGYALEAQAAQP